MSNKNTSVKIFLLIVLLGIVGVGSYFVLTNPKSNINNNTEKVEVKDEEPGTLYVASEEIIKPDIVIGDNYFDTQITDISTNFSRYEGKTVEIEGMYLDSYPSQYTFVGRYSESNLCPTCPPGYSYFEFEWHGEEELPKFTDEKEWIKVVGTFKKGVDEGEEYYYIDAATVKVMDKRGKDTVYN